MILVAAGVAIILGCIAKFGAVVRSIPNGVFGGIAFVLYSLIAITGIRIWVMNRIDFTGKLGRRRGFICQCARAEIF